MEVVILAGGKGTRLQSVVNDRPKPMADINGKPLLQYLLDFWIKQGCEHFILSVGYMHQAVSDYFGQQYRDIPISYSIENKPLGTGGAILKAAGHVQSENFVVINGDSYFDISFKALKREHDEQDADVSIALFKAENTSRYGLVDIDETNAVTGFHEKQATGVSGLFNAGTYLINKNFLRSIRFENKLVSFEEDLMPGWLASDVRVIGIPVQGMFIDIGIPEDYAKAKTLFLKF